MYSRDASKDRLTIVIRQRTALIIPPLIRPFLLVGLSIVFVGCLGPVDDDPLPPLEEGISEDGGMYDPPAPVSTGSYGSGVSSGSGASSGSGVSSGSGAQKSSRDDEEQDHASEERSDESEEADFEEVDQSDDREENESQAMRQMSERERAQAER